MQTSTHIWRQDDNSARAIFLENLAKNVLAFNFRKLEALGGKMKEMESRKAISSENKLLGYSVHW